MPAQYKRMHMRTQYLHLSAYCCDKCSGPVMRAHLRYARTKYRKRLTSGKSGRYAFRAVIGKEKRRSQALPETFHQFNGSQCTPYMRAILRPHSQMPSIAQNCTESPRQSLNRSWLLRFGPPHARSSGLGSVPVGGRIRARPIMSDVSHGH
jgi:hypothetical protein